LVLTKGRAGEFTKHPKFLKKIKNYLSAVGIVTGVLILFVTLIQFNVAYSLIWAIFLAGPFLVLWMVWAVLAAPVEVKETFEEQWYQDRKDLKKK
jgi:ABC-type bacteriocin/lantibiotic exporter with double-glycine peptidase domain